jgi:hypothetical protein
MAKVTRPEHVMVRRALAAGALAVPISFAGGWLAGGPDGAWSAVLGLAVVVANFAIHGLSLAWAAGVSVPAVQIVALGGFVARMGAVLAALFLLSRTAFFSPTVFAVAAVASTLALLGYEARLVLGGVGGRLDLPPEPPAVAAARRLRAREGAR